MDTLVSSVRSCEHFDLYLVLFILNITVEKSK